MNLPEYSNNKLNTYFNQREFVEATVAQINKDLQGLYHGEFSIDIDSSQNILDDLIKALTPVLVELSKNRPEQLAQFIYRVDLNEKRFMDSISHNLILDHLSGLIIEREAQKVYLRKRFS